MLSPCWTVRSRPFVAIRAEIMARPFHGPHELTIKCVMSPCRKEPHRLKLTRFNTMADLSTFVRQMTLAEKVLLCNFTFV